MFDSTNNRTSILVSSQLPDFVRQDHESFVKFMENYYRFMEQDGQLTYITKNFTRYLNPDILATDMLLDSEMEEDIITYNEDDRYHLMLEKLWDNFLHLIPTVSLSNRTLILKHIKDFYRASGSENSARFLMRILFNKEISFYYPKTDILKASDGKWFVERSLKVNDVFVNNVANSIAVTNFANSTIRGTFTNASATIERVEQYREKGIPVIELKLSSIVRNFQNGEKVFTLFEDPDTKEINYLSANVYGNVITSVILTSRGSNYFVGQEIPVKANSGSNASVIVTSTTVGEIDNIFTIEDGAGFQANDFLVFSGGSGNGAAAFVSSVKQDNLIHPNVYSIMSSTINLESDTPLNNAVYSNLNSTNLTSVIASGMSYWRYSNVGPVLSLTLTTGGTNYRTHPSANVKANTLIYSLGILGRLEIVNGGQNYVEGDKIEFINQKFSFGHGAMANVTNVAANGMIRTVKFEAVPGFLPGGSGYDQDNLPRANVISANGNGSIIKVVSIIGAGEKIGVTSANVGSIKQMVVAFGGSGYSEDAFLDFANVTPGSGARGTCGIVTGVITYPGRYINDDGLLSSYNFLQNRDYYQNYSYVIKIDEPLYRYKKTIKDLIHPAGMKLFGQYSYEDENLSSLDGLGVVSNVVTQD